MGPRPSRQALQRPPRQKSDSSIWTILFNGKFPALLCFFQFAILSKQIAKQQTNRGQPTVFVRDRRQFLSGVLAHAEPFQDKCTVQSSSQSRSVEKASSRIDFDP
jgi:hypothetical protein